MEKLIKQKLKERGFKEETLLNNRGLIGACIEETEQQLRLHGVLSSSDKIVIELSDKELQIVTRQELSKMQDDAMEFDGFEGWIVRGKLV
jgi:hypothetical protein